MDKNKIGMIGPVAVAGILMLAVLAAISSTNHAFSADKKPTKLTLAVQIPYKKRSAKAVSDRVPVTISGRLSNESFSPVADATIIVDCDGEQCGTSPTDSDGHYSVGASLNVPPNSNSSTNIITAVTQKVPDDYEKSENTMTAQLCEDPDHPGYWSFCPPTAK